ncbi:MAG TPA: hypothetical protein VMD91_01425 [Candidatus Sulfotelmatobacter sp.]|nr:hypothetical protein [Candidatus Sulfotelmatobacter sp.]
MGAVQLFDQLFGKRDSLWFENGAAGARQGKFQAMAISGGRSVTVMGMALAREGLAFVSPVLLGEPELQMTLAVRARRIATRVRVDRTEPMKSPDRIVHRYFCSFMAIAADDWDAVVRYVENKPEPKTVEFAPTIDDDFRSLPMSVQNDIVRYLVRQGRLQPPGQGQAPLIRVETSAPRDLGNGRVARDVLIHSRITKHQETHSFDTRFRVFSTNQVQALD